MIDMIQLLVPTHPNRVVVVHTGCLCCSPRWLELLHVQKHGHPKHFCHKCTTRALAHRGLHFVDCGGRDPWIIVARSEGVLERYVRQLTARESAVLRYRIHEIRYYAVFWKDLLLDGLLVLKASVHDCWKMRLNHYVTVRWDAVEKVLDSDGTHRDVNVIEETHKDG